MTDLYRGLDAADVDGMARNAARIKDAGLDFVMTYLKWTKPAHITAFHNAGLAVGVIFEAGAANALGGAEQGRKDGALALAQARALGVPPDMPIFATVDHGVAKGTDEMDAVVAYFGGFGALAGYACGDVLLVMERRLRDRWLAGAMGWPGSRDYYANGPWAICQGTPMRGGHQLGLDWPDLGFEYDPDVARNLDWAWMPAQGETGLPGSLSGDNVRPVNETNIREGIKSLQGMLAARGLYDGAIDGRVGPKTRAALDHFP